MSLYIIFIALILIACLLIILAVLAQSPKSGMAANFGASNQVMGVRQTSNFLEKSTWRLAVIILFLSLGATMSIPKSKITSSKGGIEKAIDQGAEANTFESFIPPANVPAGEGTTEEAPAPQE